MQTAANSCAQKKEQKLLSFVRDLLFPFLE